MSDAIKSKNLYELLGNDHDQDSDREPDPPTKTVDKPAARVGKRDAPKIERDGGAPAPRRGGDDRRRGGFNDGERTFRDRTNGRSRPEGLTTNNNRENPVENTDGTVRGRDSGPGTQRRGRGQGGPRRGGDRRDRTGREEHQKQTDAGWGKETGEGEEIIEKEGEADAQADRKNANNEDAQIPDEPIPEPEPEDNSISYSAYLEQQAAKRDEALGLKEARAANEGAKDNKKWKNATALEKENAEEHYFIGEAKAKRERARGPKKEVLDIDYTFKEPDRESSGRGGRGGRGRGGERGSYRGGEGRGRGEGRGEGRPRGEYRGGRGGDRGSYRGNRGRGTDASGPIATDDRSAFPSLGGN